MHRQPNSTLRSVISFLQDLFSSREIKIIGTWQRLTIPASLEAAVLSSDTCPNESLIISENARFTILRFEESSVSTVSGWHVGNTSGTWRIRGRNIIQLVNDEERSLLPQHWPSKYGSLFMNFKIIVLTKNRLTLCRQSNTCEGETIEYCK